MLINTNTNTRTARSARNFSMVLQSQKLARKAALGSICAHLDDKSHKLHEGCGCFRPGPLTKIVEDLRGAFPWITCNIIDKAYCKHVQSFILDS